jgi:hypothetical protein
MLLEAEDIFNYTGKARQGKARQGKARQGKARRYGKVSLGTILFPL